MRKKIAIVVGTRPEIIKMSPVIRLCSEKNTPYYIIHTGQHYDFSLDKVFFDQLNLPTPGYALNVGSKSHAKQTAAIMAGVEDVFLQEKPSIVLVQGDTNSVFAAAMVAAKMKIKIGHVEAGLRSFDRDMPEEINRVLTDHISDYLFCPTKEAVKNASREGIHIDKLIETGNTIVDAVLQNLEISKKTSAVLKSLGLKAKGYILSTFHRQENVDNKGKLSNIIQSLITLARSLDIPVIISMHPRTRKLIQEFGLNFPREQLRIIEPVGYLDFLMLQSSATLVVTDSGGLQEEACILKVPCVTIRENTERPETIEIGANILVGTDIEKIVSAGSLMAKKTSNWNNPYGDGTTAEKILSYISNNNI